MLSDTRQADIVRSHLHEHLQRSHGKGGSGKERLAAGRVCLLLQEGCRLSAQEHRTSGCGGGAGQRRAWRPLRDI